MTASDLARHRAAGGGERLRVLATAPGEHVGDGHVSQGPEPEHEREPGVDLDQQYEGDHERHRHGPEVEHHSPRRVVNSHRHLADAIGQRAGEVAKEVAL